MNCDPHVTCVYDKSHQILRSRLIVHYTKCSKNFPNSKKKHCPYDASHIVDRVDYQCHVDNCPAKETVVHYIFKEQEEAIQNLVKIEPHVIDEKGSWDNDVVETSYNPLHKIEERLVLRNISVQSKSEKKKFRNSERIRFQQLEDKYKNDTCYKDYEKAGARPKTSRYNNRHLEIYDDDSDDDCNNIKPLRPPNILNKSSMDQSDSGGNIHKSTSQKYEEILNEFKNSNGNAQTQQFSQDIPQNKNNSDNRNTSRPFSYASILHRNLGQNNNNKNNYQINNNPIAKVPNDNDKLVEELTKSIEKIVVNGDETKKINMLQNDNNYYSKCKDNNDMNINKKSSRCAAKFFNM